MAAPSDPSLKVPLLALVFLAVSGAAYLATVDDPAPTAPDAAVAPDAGAPGGTVVDLDRFYATRKLTPPTEGCRPESPDMIALLGRVAALLEGGERGSRRPEDAAAVAALEEPGTGIDTYGEYWYLKAQAELQAGAEAEVVDRTLKTGQEHCNDWLELFDLQGRLLMARGDHRAAVVQFKRAAPSAEGVPKVRLHLAQAYHAIGDGPRTLAALDELHAEVPTYLPAYRLRGEVRLEAEQADGAVADLRRYVEARPKDGRAQLALARAQTAAGNAEAARTAFCAAAAQGIEEAAEGCPKE